MLQKENQRQRSQHNIDNISNEQSKSTRVKPQRSAAEANIDLVDINYSTGKWKMGGWHDTTANQVLSYPPDGRTMRQFIS